MNNKNWKLSKIHFIHSTAFISYVSWMKFSVVYKCILAYVCTFTCMCECVCKCLFTITSVSISKCISVLKCGECAVQPTQQLLRIQTKWERIREKQKLFIYVYWMSHNENGTTTTKQKHNQIKCQKQYSFHSVQWHCNGIPHLWLSHFNACSHFLSRFVRKVKRWKRNERKTPHTHKLFLSFFLSLF